MDEYPKKPTKPWMSTGDPARDVDVLRLRLEEADRENQAHRDRLAHLNDVLFSLDDQGRFTYISPSALAVAGFTPEEGLGRSFTDFVHPADLPFLTGRFQEVLSGSIQASEYRIITKSGRTKWVRSSSRPMIVDGRAVGLHGTLSDVNERRKTEDALKESEARFRRLVEHSLFGFYVAHWPSGQTRYANPKCIELTGYSLEELKEKSLFDLVVEEEHDRVRSSVQAKADGRMPETVFGVFTLRRRDGRPLKIEAAGVLIPYENPPDLQVIFQDVTDREALQVQLQHAQKMEAVGTLASGVAHEFNNILMAIGGYSQILHLTDQLPPAVAEVLEKIDAATRRAASLTRRMLTLSRMENGERRPVDLAVALGGIQDLFRQILPRNIVIETHLPPEIPRILANPNQIEQILLNLCVNARDAMPQGGRLILGARPAVLDDAFRASHPWAQDDAFVELTVQDTGLGIPPEVLDRIFEPFFTTKGPGRGTGLGLSVVYSLARQHGGGLTVTSQPGQGACFRLYLPRASAQEIHQETGPARNQALPIGHGQRILVVDDEPDLRDVIRKLLENFHFRVDEAAHGGEAAEKYRAALQQSKPYDLVIMDLTMPVVDGRQAARTILELDPSARVIIATGRGGDRAEFQADIPGLAGILQKPFELTLLLQETTRALGENRRPGG